MANVSFDGVDLSTLGLAVHAINGRGLAAWKPDRVEILGRDILADLSAKHDLETRTVLAGKLSSPTTPWASHTHGNLLVNLDGLKVLIDPEKGFKKLVITGDQATIYRWARFTEMNFEEKFPVFKKPFEEIGLSFDNFEPFWRKLRTPFSSISAGGIYYPNPGHRKTRGKFTLTIGATIPGASLPSLFRITTGIKILPNGDVATYPGSYTGLNGVLTQELAVVRSTPNALKITANGTSPATVIANPTIPRNAARVEIGKTYTFSAYVRSAAVVRNARIVSRFADAAGTLIGAHNSIVGSTSPTSTSAWTRITATGLAPALSVLTGAVVEFASALNTEIHYVEDIQIEEGSVATNFDAVPSELPLTVKWGVVDLIAGDQIIIDSDALTVMLLRAGSTRDAVRGYLYEGPGDGFPQIVVGGSVIDQIHADVTNIVVEYDELYK